MVGAPQGVDWSRDVRHVKDSFLPRLNRDSNHSGVTKKTRRRIVNGFILAVLAISITSYFLQSQLQPDKGSDPVEKVTLGVETSILPSAVWVAENRGYFQEQGLDVTIREYDSGRLSLLAMLSGDEGVDISTVAPTPIMFNSFNRQDFSILATFVYSYDDVKVIARKDAGIAMAADLRGKKIGTPSGTTGQYFLETFLTLNEISVSEVEVLDIDPSGLPGALESNRVDAIVIWEPHGYHAQNLLGDNAVRLPDSEIYKETFNFIVMNEYARDNPEVLVKFLRAVDEATSFIQDNEEESQEIVARRLQIELEVVNILWSEFEFEISLDQSLITTLEDEARWAIRNGLTDMNEVPNYMEYIFFEALETVRPEAVRIIH